MTGCLSKCDKYQYIATSWRDFKDKGVANTTNNQVANFYVTFAITTGRNEVKEQVEFEFMMKICNIIYTQYEFVWLQYWLYDFDAFIADVGGYLGLLLGQSLFGVYQALSQCLRGNVMLDRARNLCKDKK